MASVTFDDVAKVFPDGTRAVDGLSLEVHDGEFMVFVGPSGCGKTTALRMVAGLEDVTEGTIRIGDSVANDVHPRERDIAMVFQNYALYPHMTVYDNMAFGLKLRKLPQDDIKARVDRAAGILELGPLLDRKPRQLSGGQRQRVAMGRAIVREPAVFLMDEPLSNLDAKLRVQMRTEVARIQRRLGTTMVYVTHDQTEAMTLGDRVAVMRAGIIQQVDSPATLYEDPVNLFVAGFIGSPSMNFLPGRLEGDKLELPFGTAEVPLDPGDLRAHLHAQLRVEVRERLVHQERLRVADDRATHRDALPLSAGERAGLLVQRVREPQDARHLPDAEVDLLLRKPAHPEGETHVLGGVHVRVERVVLEDHRDVAVLRR